MSDYPFLHRYEHFNAPTWLQPKRLQSSFITQCKQEIYLSDKHVTINEAHQLYIRLLCDMQPITPTNRSAIKSYHNLCKVSKEKLVVNKTNDFSGLFFTELAM
jgi:hypothetical protein